MGGRRGNGRDGAQVRRVSVALAELDLPHAAGRRLGTGAALTKGCFADAGGPVEREGIGRESQARRMM